MRKYLAVTAAICLALTAGCGHDIGLEDSVVPPVPNITETVPSTEPVTEDATENTTQPTSENEEGVHQIEDFTYKIPYELTEGEYEDLYVYVGREDMTFDIYADRSGLCTPQVYLEQAENRALKDMGAVTDVVKIGEYDTAFIKLKPDNSDNDDEYLSIYMIICGDATFSVSAKYSEPEAELAESVAKYIIATAKYVGDYETPTETRIIENDVFSIEADPKWSRDRSYSEEELSLKYTCAENTAQFCSSMTLGRPMSLTGGEVDGNAKAFAEEQLSDMSSGMMSSVYQNAEGVTEVELMGVTCYKITYETDFDFMGRYKHECYYFDHDGAVYEVKLNISRLDGWKKTEKDYHSLLDCVTIK